MFDQEQAPMSSRGTAAYPGYVTYQIQLLIDHSVWAKLYGSGSRDYDRSSGHDAGFPWGDVMAIR